MQDDGTAVPETSSEDEIISSMLAGATRFLERRADNEVAGYLFGEAPSAPDESVASWLEFNERYLLQAQRPEHPLLERIKWLRVYVSRIEGYIQTGIAKRRMRTEAEGWTPARFAHLQQSVGERLERAATFWTGTLVPQLRTAGISVRPYSSLTDSQREWCARYFREVVGPQCAPAIIDKADPMPWLPSGSVAIALLVARDGNTITELEQFALVALPNELPRLVALPDGEDAEGEEDVTGLSFVWLEDIFKAQVSELFPDVKVRNASPFRVLRQEWLAKGEDDEEEEEGDPSSALLEEAEKRHELRQSAPVVGLMTQPSMPFALRTMLMQHIGVPADGVYSISAPVGLTESKLLLDIRRPELRFPKFKPEKRLRSTEDKIFKQLQLGDIMLHHPYDSPQKVVDFVRQAALDKRVTEISQTLYKVDVDSPMVQVLLLAAAAGKYVTAVTEVRSRGNEAEMVDLVRALESSGVNVVYGLPSFRTHCKVTLITRDEKQGVRRYAHLGTGNYQDSNRVDYSLLTADPVITADLATLFECLMGYADAGMFRQLLVSPWHLRQTIISFIERERAQAQDTGTGRIILKVNGLTDEGIIEALWSAAGAGVNADIIVRSRSGLQPRPVEVSGRIRVVVPIGRFPEHGRLFFFQNGGNEELYMGSSDLQARNLDERIELLTPICDESERRRLVDSVLESYLSDPLNSLELGADLRLHPLTENEPAVPSEPASPPKSTVLRRTG